MNFWKTKTGIVTIIALLIALGGASAWRAQMRADQRNTKETNERIQRDVKSSIENATKGIKLCPLSDPDCNKR
jgi:predicted RNase H-related nuclease YkuK (DUF458 family)